MTLHHKSYGSGFPLIILHGLFGSLDNWATIGRLWGEHFHVFTYDARNHGRSPHSTSINFEIMADDLRDFMSQHHLASAHLLGHSMGGKTVMQCALTYPELARSVIVVDVAPKSYAGKHDLVLDALSALEPGQYKTRKEADQALSTRMTDVATRQFLLKNIARKEGGGFVWKMNLPVLREHYAEIAGNITVDGSYAGPALFVRAGRSRYVAEEDKPAIKRLFPKATIATLKKAGHWVHADAPDDFTSLVFRFLQGT